MTAREPDRHPRRLEDVNTSTLPASGPTPIVQLAAPTADTAGFESFYVAHRRRIASVVALTLGDRDLAAEATDEAMTRACQRWHRFRPDDNVSGWVYRVALNWATSMLRRRRRRDELYAGHAGGWGDGGRTAPDPSSAVPDPDLAAAVAALPVRLRSVVVCRIHLDLSVAETAEFLGVKPGTVKSRLSRALGELDAALNGPTNDRIGAPT